MKKIEFEEITEEQLFLEYTAECSGDRSDCCTRVCTRDNIVATAEDWGKF